MLYSLQQVSLRIFCRTGFRRNPSSLTSVYLLVHPVDCSLEMIYRKAYYRTFIQGHDQEIIVTDRPGHIVLLLGCDDRMPELPGFHLLMGLFHQVQEDPFVRSCNFQVEYVVKAGLLYGLTLPIGKYGSGRPWYSVHQVIKYHLERHACYSFTEVSPKPVSILQALPSLHRRVYQLQPWWSCCV